MASEPISLGRISGLFGVKGWVRVYSYTEPREAVLDYGHWLLRRDGAWQPAEVAEGQRHGKSVIARVDGFDNRDDAATLVGCEIAVPREAFPETEEGRYYWTDLEGLAVERQDGTTLGTVKHMMETGANDVMVIEGNGERLVPFVMGDVVINVDLAAGVITVDWEWD